MTGSMNRLTYPNRGGRNSGVAAADAAWAQNSGARVVVWEAALGATCARDAQRLDPRIPYLGGGEPDFHRLPVQQRGRCGWRLKEHQFDYKKVADERSPWRSSRHCGRSAEPHVTLGSAHDCRTTRAGARGRSGWDSLPGYTNCAEAHAAR